MDKEGGGNAAGVVQPAAAAPAAAAARADVQLVAAPSAEAPAEALGATRLAAAAGSEAPARPSLQAHGSEGGAGGRPGLPGQRQELYHLVREVLQEGGEVVLRLHNPYKVGPYRGGAGLVPGEGLLTMPVRWGSLSQAHSCVHVRGFAIAVCITCLWHVWFLSTAWVNNSPPLVTEAHLITRDVPGEHVLCNLHTGYRGAGAVRSPLGGCPLPSGGPGQPHRPTAPPTTTPPAAGGAAAATAAAGRHRGIRGPATCAGGPSRGLPGAVPRHPAVWWVGEGGH
jgi:hypothetical protein